MGFDMKNISIRKAVEADLAAINDIYNFYVINSTCTFQTEPSTALERVMWFKEHPDPYFITVAEVEGKVIGWASVSRYHPRAGYAQTVENSVYVHHEWLHQGIGQILLEDMMQHARALGFHTIIAAISDDQTASKKIHEKFGFTSCGKINEVGYKFGRWLDVAYLQLML